MNDVLTGTRAQGAFPLGAADASSMQRIKPENKKHSNDTDDDDEEEREAAELAEAMMRQMRVSASEEKKPKAASTSTKDIKRIPVSRSKGRLDVRQRPRNQHQGQAQASGVPSQRRPETRDFTFDILERKRIERENMQLVKKLASISNRRQGSSPGARIAAAQKYAPRAGSAQINSRRQQKSIDRENEALAKRLARVRGTVPARVPPSSRRR